MIGVYIVGGAIVLGCLIVAAIAIARPPGRPERNTSEWALRDRAKGKSTPASPTRKACP